MIVNGYGGQHIRMTHSQEKGDISLFVYERVCVSIYCVWGDNDCWFSIMSQKHWFRFGRVKKEKKKTLNHWAIDCHQMPFYMMMTSTPFLHHCECDDIIMLIPNNEINCSIATLFFSFQFTVTEWTRSPFALLSCILRTSFLSIFFFFKLKNSNKRSESVCKHFRAVINVIID